MSINTTLITGHTIIIDPDSIADIQTVIGSSAGDLGTLCQKNNYINKWAKYKPVTVANLLDTTSQLKGGTGSDKNQWATTATWYKGNGTCGLQVQLAPKFWNQGTSDASKTEAIKEAEAASLDEWFNSGWQYLFYPTGTMASPFRVIDFNYYDHNAVAFVKSLTYPSEDTYCSGEDAEDMTWTMVLPTGNEGNYSLGFADVSPLSNVSLDTCHFGLILVNTGSRFPSTPGFQYRKYLAINSYPISNSNGRSITLTGTQTAGLIDSSNITSAQYYTIYPIITTGTLGAATSVVLFGTTNYGSMIVVPNAEPLDLTILPNELEGFIEGNLDYYSTSGSSRVYEDTNISIINRSTKSATISSSNDILLGMELWKQVGTSYQLERTVTSGYTFPNTSFPITIQSGSSVNLGVRWLIDESYFEEYAIYTLRETGSIKYRKYGASSDSTATLLSLPTISPDVVVIPMNFQSHITIDNATASAITVSVWAENISESSTLDFNWSSIKYDVISYPKSSSGTDYQNPVISSDNSITANTDTGIAPGGLSSVQTIQITPPNGTGITGYMTSVTIHSASGYNVGDSSASVDYP